MSKKKLTKKERKALQKANKQNRTTIHKASQFQWKPILAIIFITIVVFYPSLFNEFVNWDDDRNFYENELIISLNHENFWKNTIDIFSTTVIGNYNPLTIWSFLIDQKLWGIDQPFYWHLENLILHLACVYMVYRIVLLLGLKWQGATVVALLFAIHPMRVESVAWVTERKDVLFGIFYLSAIYYYIKYKYDNYKNKKYLFVILVMFALSLLSKIQAVALPLTLICIDYYIDRKITFASIISKWFYFAISLAFGLIGIFVLKDEGSLHSGINYEGWPRIFIGAFSYLIYLVKSIIPFRLSPLYPYPFDMPSYFYPSIIIFIITPIYTWWLFKKQKIAAVFGILFFSVNIVFLLQILGAGQGFLADRFTYIPYIGLFFIAGYYTDKLLSENSIIVKSRQQLVYNSSLVLIVLIYGGMSMNQCKVWANSGTLWTHVLQYYDNVTLPFGNRGNYYREIGESKKAIADYNRCIALKPVDAAPYNSRARLYFKTKTSADTLKLALLDYNKAIELEPTKGEYYINRGAVHARLNNLPLALVDINKGLELNPDHVPGYINRFIININLRNYEDALRDITTHIKYKPYASDSHYESGRLKFILGRYNESIKDYDRAIELNNQKALYYHERSKTYFSLNDFSRAKADFNKAKSMGFAVDQVYGQTLFAN